MENDKIKEFQEIVDNQDVHEAERLLKNDPGLANSLNPEDNYTPLMVARSEEMIKLLLKYGADPRARNNIGRTPLHWLASCFHLGENTVKLLVEHGADIDAQDDDGWTPLYRAAEMVNIENVKTLVACGADVNICAYDGSSPLFAALYDYEGKNSLDVATFLYDHGYRLRSLEEAIAVNSFDWVKKYCEDHPDALNSRDRYGATPLEWAYEYEREEMKLFLKKLGAKS